MAKTTLFIPQQQKTSNRKIEMKNVSSLCFEGNFLVNVFSFHSIYIPPVVLISINNCTTTNLEANELGSYISWEKVYPVTWKLKST